MPRRTTLILFLFLFFLSGCTPTETPPADAYVNLGDLQPLPPPEESEIRPLRVAIAAVISPKGSAESYAPLLGYLSRELGRPVEAVQRRTYSEINDLLRRGEVDLAFVCTSSYLVGRREFGMQLLVAPQVHGETAYHAQIIVPMGSPAQSVFDLRGKVFAFTDPISFTGRMYPTYILKENGEKPETFFARTFFTYSHDDAIYAVADGVADGASIDGLVLNFALKRDPDLASQVRVIHTSPPFGIPPVVVGPHITPHLRAVLQEILLSMHKNPEGLAALKSLDYDRFVLVRVEDYGTAEVVETSVGSNLEPGR